MNNLHRELAPDLRRGLGADRGGGRAHAAAPPGRARAWSTSRARRAPLLRRRHRPSAGIDPPADGVQARLRQVPPLVELRAPFTLSREQIDDVARGSQDSDWQPARDAARQIAFAEDRAIFDGYPAAGIGGIRPGASNPPVILPADVEDYPMAFAQAAKPAAGPPGWTAPTRRFSRPRPTPRSARRATTVTRLSEHLRNVLDGDISGRPRSAARSW